MAKYSKNQIEAFWVNAGGPKTQAKVAAAIALAESKGIPTEVNPEGPEHAEGLWQIKGQLVRGNPLDPRVSAANAVAKWKAAKESFTPWTTYTSGAYKKYLGGSSEPAELIPGEYGIPIIGGVLKKLSGAAQSGGEAIGNTVSEAIPGLSFLKKLEAPQTWLRLAEGIGGIVLFMIGLKTLTKGTPTAGAVNVAIRQARSTKGVGAKAAKAVAK